MSTTVRVMSDKQVNTLSRCARDLRSAGLDTYADALLLHEHIIEVCLKHFSDAELAAEVHRAEWTVLHHKLKGHELSERVYGSCRFPTIPPEELAKVATVRRFAEHPHFAAVDGDQ